MLSDKIADRIQHYIDADPWRITVYEPGHEPGIDTETQIIITGRVFPAGTQGRAYYHDSRGGSGMPGIGDYLHLILFPQDSNVPSTNATIKAVHEDTNTEKWYQVMFALWDASHQQVLCQELQP